MKKFLLIILYFFITIRVNNDQRYGIENAFLVFQFTESRMPTISNEGVRLFDFEIR